jgi:hypothetical protein
MKKFQSKITFVLSMIILLTACFAIVSCGGEADKAVDDTVTVNAVLDAIIAEFPEIPAGTSFYSDSADDSEYFSSIIGPTEYGDGFELPELDVTDSYAVFVPEAKTTFNVAVFKAKTDDDAAAVKTMLESKVTAMKNNAQIKAYDDEQGTMQTMADNGKVTAYGKYIILTITSNNEKATTAAEGTLLK